jgi:hypothetical protein
MKERVLPKPAVKINFSRRLHPKSCRPSWFCGFDPDKPIRGFNSKQLKLNDLTGGEGGIRPTLIFANL